jgi:hypothetical protein
MSARVCWTFPADRSDARVSSSASALWVFLKVRFLREPMYIGTHGARSKIAIETCLVLMYPILLREKTTLLLIPTSKKIRLLGFA